MGVLTGRRERRQFLPEPVIPPYLGASVGSVNSSPFQNRPDTSLMVPTVWACVSLLANSVSMLPLKTYRKPVIDGVPTRITDPTLVMSPSAGRTQSEWLHELMVSLLMRGNAYGRITSTDAYERPTQIALLAPDTVQVKVDNNTGNVTYQIGQNTAQLTSSDIWHVRGLTLPGMQVGLSPISYAAAVLDIDASSRKFAGDFYANGGIPKSTLSTDQMITQEQARQAKERLQAATMNREPAVFGNGFTYTAISVKPEESQFLATQQADVAQIARYFGVPAEMVGGPNGSSMTYSNVEQRSIDFLTYSVSFWLKRIEDAFFPLLAQPQYVAFDTAALLRADAQTQAEVDVLNVAGKIRAPSEIRTDHNWAPLTPAQKAELELVPLTVQPTGKPKAVPTPPNPQISDDTPVVGDPPPSPQGDAG